MTDYELAMLFLEYYNTFQSQFINLVSVLFAFLVASYLVASKLKTIMVVVVIALYTSFFVDSVLVLYALHLDMLELQNVMKVRIAAGSTDLLFHTGANSDVPLLETGFVISRIIAIGGGYIGAILFFFHQRRLKPVT